jgi:hypothetical protein
MQRFLLSVATATILQLPWILSANAATPLQSRVDTPVRIASVTKTYVAASGVGD